jgi:hypothetical protein
MPSQTPKTVKELVDQLMFLENENRALKTKNAALNQTIDRGRQQAVSMHTKSSKKSTFSNYEVKEFSKELLKALEQTQFKR